MRLCYINVFPNFSWKLHSIQVEESMEDVWLGVMANCLWMLKQTDKHLMYKVISELPYPSTNKNNIVRMKIDKPKKQTMKQMKSNLYNDSYYDELLRSYFRLDVNLEDYYKQWSVAHKHFKEEAGQFYAVRVLNQEPVENLFSFICSQNNNISR